MDFVIWNLTFRFEACSVAEHDSIPNPIRWESGNLRGKEDVGLGNRMTERNMC